MRPRHEGLRAEVSLDQVVDFVTAQGPGRWTMATRVQFASKLLSSACSVGLVVGRRDPRGLAYPPLSDDALSYTLYLAEIDAGRVANVAAPEIAIRYWNLPADARLRDVVLVVRQDEMGHRDVNHAFADTLAAGDAHQNA